MKLVLDTNVLLAGVFTRGICQGLLDVTLGSPDHTVSISQAILEEFTDVAKRKFRAPSDIVRTAADLLASQMVMVKPAEVSPSECRDPDDLAILGTLLSADADWLVTGDADLLVLKQFRNREIITPRECFERLRRSS